jgi:hypothetical protein
LQIRTEYFRPEAGQSGIKPFGLLLPGYGMKTGTLSRYLMKNGAFFLRHFAVPHHTRLIRFSSCRTSVSNSQQSKIQPNTKATISPLKTGQ